MDSYATHLPVLEQVTAELQPKCVLEYGGGNYSTPFFLGLPYLEWLITVEDDVVWREQIRRNHRDPRLIVTEVAPPMDYDLILIDNSNETAKRIEKIREVLSEPHPTVLIHDAEVPAYQEAIRESGREFTIAKPNTAIVEPCVS